MSPGVPRRQGLCFYYAHANYATEFTETDVDRRDLAKTVTVEYSRGAVLLFANPMLDHCNAAHEAA